LINHAAVDVADAGGAKKFSQCGALQGRAEFFERGKVKAALRIE
jgi:hypothetical protein